MSTMRSYNVFNKSIICGYSMVPISFKDQFTVAIVHLSLISSVHWNNQLLVAIDKRSRCPTLSFKDTFTVAIGHWLSGFMVHFKGQLSYFNAH